MAEMSDSQFAAIRGRDEEYIASLPIEGDGKTKVMAPVFYERHVLVEEVARLRAALAGAKQEGAEDAWRRVEGQSPPILKDGNIWKALQAAKAAHLKELGRAEKRG